ncbi:MAG: hypothetical protein V1707_01630 [bacterium]
MDILAHGLWTGACAVGAKRKWKELSVRQSVFWGIAPDLLSFTVLFFWFVGSLLLGDLPLGHFPSPDSFEPSQAVTLPIFQLTDLLYSISHSVVVFIIVFGLVWLFKRKPRWELFGWLFHIVIDIFTHEYAFYPTPFLWPLSDLKVDGYSWARPWFMVINYLLLAGVYGWMVYKKRSSVTS